MELVEVTIDGRNVQIEKDRTVLDAARKLNIDIPTLCHHEALEPYGACRLCLVEATQGKRTRIVTSCNYPVSDGLDVRTNTDKVVKLRRGVAELLLARCPNSPEVRAMAAKLGVDETPFKKSDEQCILCGLCVRVCRDVMGVGAIGFVNRGSKREISTPFKEMSDVCVSCGACAFVCPTGAITLDKIREAAGGEIRSTFEAGLATRPAIYRKYAQAVPNKPVIDRERCAHLLLGTCKACEAFCEAGAIDFEQKDEDVRIDVGAVVVAPGFDGFKPEPAGRFGYAKYPNVVTSIEFERILSASGPFNGHVVRPSDMKEPRTIGFIQCVGSRDVSCNSGYCSSVCCTYAIKQAIVAKEHLSTVEPTIFFIERRTQGKDFDKYAERAQHEYGIQFITSGVSDVIEDPATHDLMIRFVDESGTPKSLPFDMVVLSVGLHAPESAVRLSRDLGFGLNKYQFALTKPFSPLETSRDGVYVCGAFGGPKDIPQTVADASAAAGSASALLASARHTLTRVKEYPPEKDVSGQEPRIGVFVCHCGINIGGVVNVPQVKEFAATLDNVVLAEENLYTCSQDTQERMKALIQEHNLNRVVVASCSPRTHEPLFRETVREAGLNPYLFEMTNIRDQCSWVHRDEPVKATEKAKDLVRMAVAKARLLEPLYPRSLELTHEALVIGGGVSGMVAALAIAEQGFPVHLVEKEHELGGNARRLHYSSNGGDPQRYVNELVNAVQTNRFITVHTATSLVDFSGFVGNFEAGLMAEGKTYVETIKVGAVIVATGANEYRPSEYLYGMDPRVVTALELEERIAQGEDAINGSKNVVMIQCVGSREPDYMVCSRNCCAHAVKNALKLKRMDPEINVYVLYRDMRTYGFLEEQYRQAREQGVIFIRYELEDKPVVEAVHTNGSQRLHVTVKDRVLGAKLTVDADLVALSTGVRPPAGNREIAQLLKVPLNDEGFFLEAHMKLRPVDFATDGVFMCGLAHAPKSLEESAAQAKAAAGRAVTILAKDSVLGEGVVSAHDPDFCSTCRICVGMCPYEAITYDYNKKIIVVNDAQCKGCGTCVAACPAGVMTARHFTDEQVFAQIEAALA
jgi:heterodisulfide reductase subunit A